MILNLFSFTRICGILTVNKSSKRYLRYKYPFEKPRVDSGYDCLKKIKNFKLQTNPSKQNMLSRKYKRRISTCDGLILDQLNGRCKWYGNSVNFERSYSKGQLSQIPAPIICKFRLCFHPSPCPQSRWRQKKRKSLFCIGLNQRLTNLFKLESFRKIKRQIGLWHVHNKAATCVN